MHLYSIEEFFGEAQRFAQKQDMFAFDLNIELLRQNLLEAFLKYYGDYFRRPNELLPVLHRHSQIFARQMGALSTTISPRQCVKILHSLVQQIYKLLGPLPDEWRI